MADEDKFPLVTAFNQAIIDHYPSDGAPLDDVLEAAATIAAAYISSVEDPEEKTMEVECLVATIRKTVHPDGDPDLCLGCAFTEAFNRKFPDGRTTEADKEMLDVLSRMSAQFLEGASERGLKTFFDLIRTHRADQESEGPMPSHLTH